MDNNHFKNLSYRDLNKIALICQQLHEVDANNSFIEQTHQTLGNALDKIHLSTEQYLKSGEVVESVAPTLDDSLEEVLRTHVMEHPCAQRIMSRRTADVEAVHRVPTYQHYLKTTLYNEFYVPTSSSGLAWVSLRQNNQVLLCAFARDTLYSEKELAMLHLIQPHLQIAWTNWMREKKLKSELHQLKNALRRTEEVERAAANIRSQIRALPPRQREVVELASEGNDNQQIADALKISVFTVKKHFQQIFRSLGVQHRTELVAKWYKGHSVIIKPTSE